MRGLRLLLPLVVGCVSAAPAAADTPVPPPAATVPAGIVLGGIPIGGLTQDAAVALVAARFSRPVVLNIGETRLEVTPASLGVEIWADSGVAAAMNAAPGTTLGLRAGVDRARVSAYVARLAKRLDRRASSARLLLRNQQPLVLPSRTGLRIRQGAAAALIDDELVHGTRAPVVVPVTRLAPQTASVGPVIVIQRGSNVLTLYDGAHLVRRFHVATGQAAYPTPLGRFRIVVKWKDPTWYPPTQDAWAKGLKPVPPGPDNPLGTRWMGISSPGVGIHGTDEPASIGYSESHGCIRMLVSQAEWLFDRVDVGTPVYILPS